MNNDETELRRLAAWLIEQGPEATTDYIREHVHDLPEGLLAAIAEAKREQTAESAEAAPSQDILTDKEQEAYQRYRDAKGSAIPGAEKAAAIWQLQDEEADRRAAAARFPFKPLAEIAAEVEAAGSPTWLFDGVVVSGDYGVLSAEKKAGKTWAMADAAVSCAAGLPWLGHFSCQTPGPVMIFYNEGSRRKLLRRLRAVGVSKGLSNAVTDALPIHAEFIAPQLRNEADLEAIGQRVEGLRPSLVIVDPLYRSASGAKLADLYSMGDLLGRLQERVQGSGATLFLSHHWNKAAAAAATTAAPGRGRPNGDASSSRSP